MNRIKLTTRKTIFDFIQLERIWWFGNLDELKFLSRIFDLKSMESFDSRFSHAFDDIWQHCINNPDDWVEDWIFHDPRFNLQNCSDNIFLNFLCEMLHPLVRQSEIELERLLMIFNSSLKNDGFEIVEDSKIVDKPIFVGREMFRADENVKSKAIQLKEIFNETYVQHQIDMMNESINTAPHISIGLAKELIETCCKSIFDERLENHDRSWDLVKLMKETAKLMQLTPEDIDEQAKASKSIKQILGSLASVVHGIAEVRNVFGGGHGKGKGFKGLQPRHARLAVGAASTLAIYLLETHETKKAQ